jgi:AGZA family xanthine/uracil permease-like MFS transporter
MSTAPGDVTTTSTPRNGLDRFFEISARGSTVGREVRGGLATFFTMAYIVVLNPLILGGGVDAVGGRLPIAALAAGTALVAGLMTILMGVVARFPLALAAGLGVNALVAYEIAPEMTWADAMGLVVIEGVLITVLVLTGLRTTVFRAVPTQLKTAIGVGIGLFLMIIGLVDAGFVRRTPDAANTTVPVQLGIGGVLTSWPSLVFVLGLLLTIVLFVRRVRGAILIGILGTTVLAIIVEAIAKVGPSFVDGQPNPKGWSLNVPTLPDKIVDLPDLSLIGHFNVLDSWSRAGWLVVVMFIFTLMITDFFDTMGTMVAVGQGPTCWTTRACRHGPGRSCWSTRSPRRPAARPACPATPRTSKAPRVSPRVPGPAWRTWSPAGCSCSRCSSSRWSPSCRSKPPRSRWCWSAS